MKDVSFTLSFLAGVLSFLSPCVLPLVPAYVSFITGISIDELRHSQGISKTISRTMPNTIAFILGFSTIFISLGASSSLLGGLFLKYQDYLRIGGGILTIVFGLFVAGFIKLDFLMREKRFHISKGPTGYISAFLIGMSFAAGWTPCIGPILGTILIYASSQASASYGLKLLSVYSLGLAIPFILATLAINAFFTYIQKIHKFMRAIMLISGLILIAFGILLLTNNMGQLSAIFPDLGVKF
ncbi:cytochrome C biogenesis protein CcdA [Dissulfurispira thermophila]|uniref:Cytochrome C biogenesis protein CcdA n=2 Tax=root TaxID=1 RepID=A0A7G1GYW0_9BACT|nr:cytochrome c biogenesis protein CcdA [Dissulfurispira thermophila]BCB95252.1 cytochrome C biogenesis protein CcdA [Dissulfurispira thermophila]